MKVLVSACLMGSNCKYNGKNNYNDGVAKFVKDKEVITICPELLAGMGAPRNPVEISSGRIVDEQGNDMDTVYHLGVDKAMEQISEQDIDLVVLQSRSPTCGVHQIYDGTFSGKLIDGQGIFAKALIEKGYHVLDAEDIHKSTERK